MTASIFRALHKYCNNQSGAVGITFGIVGLVAIMLAGVGVDYARQSRTHALLQSAADAGVLAAANAKWSNHKLSKKQIKQVARKFFDENKVGNPDIKIKQFRLNDDQAEEVSLEVSGEIGTRLLNVVGVKKMAVTVRSSVVRGETGELEVALVLDNTGSMRGSRLTALKASARIFVDEVMPADARDNKVKVALIPFTQYVNVGLHNRNQPWLDVPEDREVVKENQCYTTRPIKSKSNCRNVTGTYYDDGIAKTYSYETCDYVYGKPKRTCRDTTITYRWRGCVGSRNHPLNVRDQSPGIKIPGLQNVTCGQPMLPLSSNRSNVLSQVSQMNAIGSTYIPSGIMWGWRALSNQAPFSEGVSYNQMKEKNLRKVMVLMTDGENTMAPNYPEHNRRNKSEADRLTEEICKNAKKASIEIFAVTFEVRDNATKRLMKKCVSAPQNYFDAEGAEELKSAFRSIGNSLSQLRIQR